MNKFFDDFNTDIQSEDLDIEGYYDFILNEDDNEYFHKVENTFNKYF